MWQLSNLMPEALPPDIVLNPYDLGWVAEVPKSRGSFLSHEILLRIHTRSEYAVGEAPQPDASELELTERILRQLPALMADCETQFQTYAEKSAPEAVAHISNPHIWIDRESVDDGFKWTFIVERNDAPSVRYHIDFEDMMCFGIWAES